MEMEQSYFEALFREKSLLENCRPDEFTFRANNLAIVVGNWLLHVCKVSENVERTSPNDKLAAFLEEKTPKKEKKTAKKKPYRKVK